MAIHAESSIQLNTIPAYTSLLGGHFVYRANGTQTTPASANVINGDDNFNMSNPQTWGYNTHIGASGIKLRFRETDLSEWSNGGLKFYKAPTISGDIVTQGALAMELTDSVLNFYGSSTSTPDATLTSNGLKLVKGGIEAGKPNTTDYIYVWSINDEINHTFSINNSGNKFDWRIVAGQQFGVDKAGNLYASNVDISGTINAESGSIGGFTIGSTELYSQDKTSAVGLDEGTYIGPNGFGISGGDALNTTYFTQDAVSIGGLLEWTAASGEEEQSNLSIYATEIYLGTLGDGLVPSNLNFLQDATADDDFAIKTLLTNTITEISSHKTQIEENKEKAERMIADFDNYYKPYITTTENNQNGYIQLKRKDNNNASSIKITDSKIEISINQQIITAFEGTLMKTTFGEFENLRMKANSYTNNSGYLTWIARSNGHLSLKVVK